MLGGTGAGFSGKEEEEEADFAEEERRRMEALRALDCSLSQDGKKVVKEEWS